MNDLVLVLDFGGQYKELIAGAIRAQSVYSEIVRGGITAAQIGEHAKGKRLIGLILTGGPDSVYSQSSPKCDPAIFSMGIPVLGICYGMHLMCHILGGKVESAESGEYGTVAVSVTAEQSGSLLPPKREFSALMSHRDRVTVPPPGFTATMRSESCEIAAFEDVSRKLYGVQFHPETKHTEDGAALMRSFLHEICGARGDYKLDDYIETQIREIREKVGERQVLLGLSGGVDSSVCAALLEKAMPNKLVCVFVDHGLMRLNEGDEIEAAFAGKSLRFVRVNAQERFLSRLAGVTEPEKKRKIIGEEFVRVFEEQAKSVTGANTGTMLAQGTIYPDIVESGDSHGDVIKSHHNVGGLPENLDFEGLVEPLSGLFKDEVRKLGEKLGLPEKLVRRQPFPGPGLAVRVVGEITREKLDVLRLADAIVREEIERAVSPPPSQYFAVMSSTWTVGVKGDRRTYSPVIAVRAVNTDDFMTCEYAPLPHEVLSRISSRITNEIPEASRVVYDITAKPPSTIEWE